MNELMPKQTSVQLRNNCWLLFEQMLKAVNYVIDISQLEHVQLNETNENYGENEIEIKSVCASFALLLLLCINP